MTSPNPEGPNLSYVLWIIQQPVLMRIFQENVWAAIYRTRTIKVDF